MDNQEKAHCLRQFLNVFAAHGYTVGEICNGSSLDSIKVLFKYKIRLKGEAPLFWNMYHPKEIKWGIYAWTLDQARTNFIHGAHNGMSDKFTHCPVCGYSPETRRQWLKLIKSKQ